VRGNHLPLTVGLPPTILLFNNCCATALGAARLGAGFWAASVVLAASGRRSIESVRMMLPV
jgi:hypothetical protein